MNRKWVILNLYLKKNGTQRAGFLKPNNVFFGMGEHCYWHPRTIPSEPYLLRLHNNVVVAAGVSFHTHDVMEYMFNYIQGGGNISNILDQSKFLITALSGPIQIYSIMSKLALIQLLQREV